MTLLAGLCLLTACGGNMSPLQPAWQQDPNFYHHGVPARPSQTATTPHLVARVIYAAPDQVARMVERQGDVVDPVRGLARMGDGTLDLGLQDVVTGKWLDACLCGGHLFVAGLPHQAYRIVLRNRTPMPLEVGIGADGKDVQSGGVASLRRGSLRVPAKGTVTVESGASGPLLFQTVRDDGALYHTTAQGRTGLIQIAVYLAADAPSVGPQKLPASQLAPLGLLPAGVPEQYR